MRLVVQNLTRVAGPDWPSRGITLVGTSQSLDFLSKKLVTCDSIAPAAPEANRFVTTLRALRENTPP